MSWEVRGTSRYYTRSRRVNGRIQREYLGTGAEAHLAAALDAARRRQREACWAAVREERSRWAPLTSAADGMIGGIELLVQGVLLVAGYHQHERGPWRRRREVQDE